MHDAITDVPGIEVGHDTDADAVTGCTAVVCRAGAVAGVAVRGAAPGTRETDLCRPGTLVERRMRSCCAAAARSGSRRRRASRASSPAQGIGYDAGGIRVPIVPAAVIFDLALGEVAWPDVEAGRRAARGRDGDPPAQGCVGAGTGATVGKVLGWRGRRRPGSGPRAPTRAPRRSGRSSSSTRAATSSTRPAAASSPARARPTATAGPTPSRSSGAASTRRRRCEQTTIAVVATDAPLTVEQANHLASVAHDGLARTIRPVHTMHDGDTIFALATGARRAARGSIPPR